MSSHHSRSGGAPRPVSVCIIGAGFRGLGVLERLVAHVRTYEPTRTIRVHLVESSRYGPEQYDARQPDYLLLNIVCGQVSIFPDVASVGECPPTPGPNLHEWVAAQGLLLGEDGFTVGRNGRPIDPGDFLPRRLLGEYLVWFRDLLTSQAGSQLEITNHSARAADVVAHDELCVTLIDGTTIVADYLFLTVGEIPEPIVQDVPSNRRISRPYPLPGQLESIDPGEVVAVAGLGLTAVDAVLSLTLGRGGRIEMRSGVEWYVPSGHEPRIVAFSRSGLPYRARPALGAPLHYDALVFTPTNIDRRRADRGPQLDYDNDVLPLLLTELRIAYWRAWHARDIGWDFAERFVEDLRDVLATGQLDDALADHDTRHGAFDPHAAYLGAIPSDDSAVLENHDAYQEWYRRWLDRDLTEARLGVSQSPLKAALEICREFRDVIRYAVDFGGLTRASADRFFSFHAETLNRIGVGPQKERSADILALIRAGVLTVPLGPNPSVTWDASREQWRLRSTSLQQRHDMFADWLYSGSVHRLRTLTADSGVVGAMARRGVLRRFRPDSAVVRGVDVDRSFHPLSRAGNIDRRIWVFGLLCDGVTFYNGYVTSPGKFVRSQHDADRAVAEIFSELMRDARDAATEGLQT